MIVGLGPVNERALPNIGLLVFPGAEELDFVGPWEVFATAESIARGRLGHAEHVWLIAERAEPFRCGKGMKVIPDHDFESVPKLDVLLAPGGMGTRGEANNKKLLAWARDRATEATWITSVCTGALLLCAAGLTSGKRITTHWSFADQLAARFPDVTVAADERVIFDGNLVTSAGVSAGIDMALMLLARLYDDELAQKTQKYIQYDPQPPYDVEFDPNVVVPKAANAAS